MSDRTMAEDEEALHAWLERMDGAEDFPAITEEMLDPMLLAWREGRRVAELAGSRPTAPEPTGESGGVLGTEIQALRAMVQGTVDGRGFAEALESLCYAAFRWGRRWEREASGGPRTAPEPSEAAIRAAAREVRFRDGFGYDDLVRQMLRAAYAVDALGGSPHPPAGDTEAERRRLWEAIQSLRSPDFGDMAVIDARARLVDQRINELVRAALRGGSHQPEEAR